ncbi:OLC1v1038749C2 [Oldenlandia corymbosa var. corymbosa]|nr:OLC1v1038749C2 [Oldenlandia corymbosa var. corymbosa]
MCIHHGFLPSSISICAALIHRYGTFEAEPATLYSLFYQTLSSFPSCTFLYNVFIRAHSGLGLYFQGLKVYNEMVRNDVKTDDHTYPFVLKHCSEWRDFQKGVEVHGTVIKVGLDQDTFVSNTLMLFYGNCGDVKDVEQVFHEMPRRDVVSWNTMICFCSDNACDVEVLDLFKNMFLQSEFRPNIVSLVSVLPVCARRSDGTMTSAIHGYSVKVGLVSQVRVGNALVDAYGKCRKAEATVRVFDEMVEKNEASWNTVITSFAYIECYRDALESFRFMIGENVKLNPIALSSILPVLVELELFSKGREVHCFSIRTGMDRDIFVANSLIHMYAKAGRSMNASSVFSMMDLKNIISWNTMVANFALNGLELEAIDCVRQMQVHGQIPTSITYTNVLPACARIGSLRLGKEIHGMLIRGGSHFDLYVSNALTDMYAKCGSLKLAENVFVSSRRDVVSYNILIQGYSQTDDCSNSLLLFSDMLSQGIKHNVVSYMAVLSACSHISAIKQGKEIHAFAVRRLFHEQLFVANSLLDMYTKSARIDLAKRVFDRIPVKDSASWNTMIMGFGMLGELDTALNLFNAMKKDGVEYNDISYIAILSACSHGGLVGQGRKIFDSMISHGVEPSHMHYACMVDLLGRSGLIGEAVELVKSLPFEGDANVWGSLLGACRLHGEVELGCWAAEHLLKLNTDHSGYHTLVSNMYAEAGKWEEADRVRELMRLRGLKKNPGYSWVQNEDQVYDTFFAGERLKVLQA